MEYSIEGGTLPAVICYLNEGEKIITENGAMAWMTNNMKMQTTLGKGFWASILASRVREATGENTFVNTYTAESGTGMIALTSQFPGSIVAFNIAPGQEIIAQKRAFLGSEATVKLSYYLQKKVLGYFAGEGFVMQKICGQGLAFLEFDGSVKEYDLQEGQQLIISTGYLAAMSATCTMNVVRVKGLRNAIWGAEGLFNTVVTGPGRVWLQTMPLSMLAKAFTPKHK